MGHRIQRSSHRVDKSDKQEESKGIRVDNCRSFDLAHKPLCIPLIGSTCARCPVDRGCRLRRVGLCYIKGNLQWLSLSPSVFVTYMVDGMGCLNSVRLQVR